jgi:hypothetical protein
MMVLLLLAVLCVRAILHDQLTRPRAYVWLVDPWMLWYVGTRCYTVRLVVVDGKENCGQCVLSENFLLRVPFCRTSTLCNVVPVQL